MLAASLDVTFAYGSESRVFTCNLVKWGLEMVGRVDRRMDKALMEVYHGRRRTLEIWIKLNLEETIWIKNFLLASDKQLTVDGSVYSVVNGETKISFPLYKENNIGAFPKLKFRNKTMD